MTLVQPSGWGALAFGALLAVYFGALTLISGWEFTVGQFAEFWYYIVPLAAGFGIQVVLYVRLRQTIRRARDSGAVLAASGTTSTAAMVSCCAHYFANAAPVLGATGLVAFAAQFQVELFWVGLLSNAAGIAYVGYHLFNASRAQAPAIDPVCGMSVEPGSPWNVGYGGRTYRFCSEHCAARFRSQPSRYIGSDALKPGAAAG
jgi:YHS domain-containing protein